MTEKIIKPIEDLAKQNLITEYGADIVNKMDDSFYQSALKMEKSNIVDDKNLWPKNKWLKMDDLRPPMRSKILLGLKTDDCDEIDIIVVGHALFVMGEIVFQGWKNKKTAPSHYFVFDDI